MTRHTLGTDDQRQSTVAGHRVLNRRGQAEGPQHWAAQSRPESCFAFGTSLRALSAHGPALRGKLVS